MKKKLILISVALVAMLMIISSGCSKTVSTSLDDSKESKTGNETTNTQVNNISKIWINNNVGTIKINKTHEESVKVVMKKTVRGQDEKEVKEVNDKIKTKSQVIDGRLEIEAIAMGEKGNVWSWLSSNHNKLNVSIDLVIDVPESFNDYTIKSVTGDITINDVAGCFNVENTTGSINLCNNILYGSNHISLVTGDVDMNVDLKNADGLEAKDCTGNLILTIPSSSQINLSASVVTGDIKGSFNGVKSKSGFGGVEFKGDLNGGGKNVTLKSVTGDVTVNSR